MPNRFIQEINSSDIVERLVGITPLYLQNFIQRGVYGLRASVKPGKLRAQRRLFSREDVFGIALVWLLFESGLRRQPIMRILKEVAGSRKVDANLAAKKLSDTRAEYLLIARTPRSPSKSIPNEPGQKVQTSKQSELGKILRENTTANLVVIPVGNKFEDIRKRMEILF